MIKVTNKNGCEIDFEAAAQHMDSKIGDKLWMMQTIYDFEADKNLDWIKQVKLLIAMYKE